MRPIGYYVHHQGHGHWQRAHAIAAHLRRPCHLIGTFPPGAMSPHPLLPLPDDALPAPPARPADRPADTALHYAPPGGEGLRRRAALVAGWIAGARPALMVVDVSVEMVLLARLCGTPVLSVRLAGQRDDPPHRAAFEASEALIVPFPKPLDEPALPGWVLERSFHAGFLAAGLPPAAARPPGRRVLAVTGRGGGEADGAALAAAAEATPEWHWQVAGPVRPAAAPGNLDWLGWVDDIPRRLAQADIVIGGCGDGLLAEVAAQARRFICIPEPRPFAEQTSKAARLAALGAALVPPGAAAGWPAPAAWPGLLRAAQALDPARIAALTEPDAARRAAAFIEGQALEAERRYGEG